MTKYSKNRLIIYMCNNSSEQMFIQPLQFASCVSQIISCKILFWSAANSSYNFLKRRENCHSLASTPRKTKKKRWDKCYLLINWFGVFHKNKEQTVLSKHVTQNAYTSALKEVVKFDFWVPGLHNNNEIFATSYLK